MIQSFSLKQVQKITGGELSGEDVLFNSVSIDSRTLQPGALFVAITGPNFDGNDYINSASEKHAIAAMTNRKCENTLPALRVKDTRLALGKISAMNRELSKACVIGLTGSQGKTTVKEMVGEILSNCGEVFITKGNLNNDLGVPLSLLGINVEHDFAVIEMGANAPGEIAYTAELVKPDIAHITNVAGTHLEGFGDINTVAKSKGELWDSLKSEGIAVLNIDDKFSESWHQQLEKIKVVTVSACGKDTADYYVTDSQISRSLLRQRDLSTFTINSAKGSFSIELALPGMHNIANALAAAAISLEAGAMIEDVRAGLKRTQPVPGRLQCRTGLNQSIIIDDSYNASPSSFNAAIDVLSSYQGLKILVAGDMGELGSNAKLAHEEVGRYAKQQGIDFLFCIGELSKYIAEGFGNGAVVGLNKEQLSQEIIPLLDKDVNVLVKGSRSAGMEKLVQKILEKEVDS